MEKRIITTKQLTFFKNHLLEAEHSKATVEKYLREVTQFSTWLCGANVTKAAATQWKEHLIAHGYNSSTINGKLTALNHFFEFLGWTEFQVKYLKLQRRLFRDDSRELTKHEYERLIYTADTSGKTRLSLVMETICATGIRVSEVKYITVEAVKCGKAEVSLKGKIRTILIPRKLCRKLLKYAQKNSIASGEIFLTRGGKSLNRKQIWAEMKIICEAAGIKPSKVFPHNLRHLFAKTFYRICRDVVKLADVLGHSSIETTRIYLISSGAEHAKTLNQLRLIS